MACGCGGGNKAATMSSVQKYKITDDQSGTEYITEREALVAKDQQGLTGDVVPV